MWAEICDTDYHWIDLIKLSINEGVATSKIIEGYIEEGKILLKEDFSEFDIMTFLTQKLLDTLNDGFLEDNCRAYELLGDNKYDWKTVLAHTVGFRYSLSEKLEDWHEQGKIDRLNEVEQLEFINLVNGYLDEYKAKGL